MAQVVSWEPLSREDLERLVASELADCRPELRSRFESARVPLQKWQQNPWGDQGGGFWVVAVHHDRVLWYNDIEEGFNVSAFTIRGEIPTGEYGCNQDSLEWALPRLFGPGGPTLGPPEPVPDEEH